MNASWGVYFLTILYLVLGCICLCGNVWVLMTVIYHLKQHRTFSAANYRWVSAPVMQSSAIIYLIALSVVDLVSIVCAPMLVHDIILNQWPYGVIMCKVFFVCENANKSLSPLILTALSVDRYIAVCHSGMQWLRETKFAITVIFICISISLLFTIPVVSESGVNPLNDRKDVEHSKCVVVMSMTFDVLHTAACYVLPLIFILSVYIAIFNRLYWHTRYSKVGQKTAINLTRVVRSSVLVVAFYFICWTPYWTHRIYYIMTRLEDKIYENVPHSYPSTPYTITTTMSTVFPKNDELSFTSQIPSVISTGTAAKLAKNIQLFASLSSTNYSASNFVSTPSTITNIFNETLNKSDDFEVWDFLHVLSLYLLHALPYTQSAFNWLFYAFLNQNLRNPNKRKASQKVIENQNTSNVENLNGTNGYTSVLMALKNFSTNISQNIFNSPSMRKSDILRRGSMSSQNNDGLKNIYLTAKLKDPEKLSSSNLLTVEIGKTYHQQKLKLSSSTSHTSS